MKLLFKTLNVIIFFVINFSSCNAQNEKYINISTGNSKFKEFKIPIHKQNPISFHDFFKINNDTCFIFQIQYSKTLYIYNLNKEKLDSIILPKPNIHQIHFIQYNNLTFTIGFNMFHDEGDSTFIYDINFNGKILKKYSLMHNKINNNDYFIISSPSLYNNKWYFLIKSRSIDTNYYNLMVYNLSNEKFETLPFKTIPFDYKKLDSDYSYPFFSNISNNCLAILNQYRSTITVLNTITNKISIIKSENLYLDTNFMYSNNFSRYKGFYWSFDYFPSLSVYRRWLVLGYEYAKKEIFVYYDTLFNIIGYQFVGNDFIYEKNGIYYSFKKRNNKEIILKIFPKLELVSIDKKHFEEELLNIFNKYNIVCTMNQFDPSIKYNKFIEMLSDSIKDKNFKLLVISGTSCPACNIDVYNMTLINENFLMNHPKYPMYILLLDTMNVFYEYKHQFVSQNHIFIDKEHYYEVLFSNKMNINPIIITVRNRKVKSIVPFDVEDNRNSKFLKALFDFD